MTCSLCTDTTDLVFENEHARVLLHPDWSPRGHAMIVARRHVENASGLTSDEWLGFAHVWQQTERALLALTGVDRAMILKLGIVTPHLHVHIYPARSAESREDVFAAFDGKRSEPRDEAFVAALRRHLTVTPH